MFPRPRLLWQESKMAEWKRPHIPWEIEKKRQTKRVLDMGKGDRTRQKRWEGRRRKKKKQRGCTVYRETEKEGENISASTPLRSIEAINTPVEYVDQEHLSHLPFEVKAWLWTSPAEPQEPGRTSNFNSSDWLLQVITGRTEISVSVTEPPRCNFEGRRRKQINKRASGDGRYAQRDAQSGKTKRAIVRLIGRLFNILVSMRTQERAKTKQVVTSKSAATHPVGFYEQAAHTQLKHRAANEETWEFTDTSTVAVCLLTTHRETQRHAEAAEVTLSAAGTEVNKQTNTPTMRDKHTNKQWGETNQPTKG